MLEQTPPFQGLGHLSQDCLFEGPRTSPPKQYVIVPEKRKYEKTPGRVLFRKKVNKWDSMSESLKASHQHYAFSPVRVCQRWKLQQGLKLTPQNRRKSDCLPSYARARSGFHRRTVRKQSSDEDLADIPVCILVQLSSGFICSSFAAVDCGNDDPSIPMDCLASE